MDCWDLEAVVKGCGYAPSSPAATLDSFTAMLQHQPTPITLPDFNATVQNVMVETEELYRRPFIYQQWTSPPQQHLHLRLNPSTSSDAVLPMPYQPQQRRLQAHRAQQAQLARPKRSRKSQLKKVVCEIPVDSAAPDLWAWRKYGQKPIKGSPYPRGYYRCSSSKGCPARKQVERSRADPGVLVITYTAEHNHPVPTHRSSLAGSTRHKLTAPPPSSQTVQATEKFSPTTPVNGSSLEELLRQRTPEEEEEEELLLRDLELMGDDFLDVSFFPEAWMAERNGAAAVGGG